MGLQESLLVTAIGAIIAGCGIQTIRKNLRNMRERRRQERLLAKVGLSGKPLDFMRARCAGLLTSPQVMQFARPYVDARRRLEQAASLLQGYLRPREEPRRSRLPFRRAQAA